MISKLRFNTVVSRKLLMGITGLAMSLYLVGHLAGNLQLLWNQPGFNAYAHFLTVTMKPVVWVVRIGLLSILVIHVVDSLVLLSQNYAARPVPYHTKTWGRTKSKKSRKSWASTLMQWSGLIVLAFIIFHIWHFTGKHPVTTPVPGHAEGEVFPLAQMVINELRNPFITGFYLFSLGLIGMHLWHGISSALYTLGVTRPKIAPLVAWAGYGFTVVIIGGFMLFPLLVVSGLLKTGVAPH